MDFKKRKLSFTLDGEKYSLDYPSMGNVRDYQKKLKKGKEGEELDILVSFFEELGLAEGVGWELESSHLTQLSEELLGTKKK